MDLLNVHREQRHPDVVYVGDRSAGAVLECIAGFEIFKIKTGGFAIPLRAKLSICCQHFFHTASYDFDNYTATAIPARASMSFALRAMASSTI